MTQLSATAKIDFDTIIKKMGTSTRNNIWREYKEYCDIHNVVKSDRLVYNSSTYDIIYNELITLVNKFTEPIAEMIVSKPEPIAEMIVSKPEPIVEPIVSEPVIEPVASESVIVAEPEIDPIVSELIASVINLAIASEPEPIAKPVVKSRIDLWKQYKSLCDIYCIARLDQLKYQKSGYDIINDEINRLTNKFIKREEPIDVVEPIVATIPQKPLTVCEYDELTNEQQEELETHYENFGMAVEDARERGSDFIFDDVEDVEAVEASDKKSDEQLDAKAESFYVKHCGKPTYVYSPVFRSDADAKYAVKTKVRAGVVHSVLNAEQLINNFKQDIETMEFREELLTYNSIKPYFDFDLVYPTEQEMEEHYKSDKYQCFQICEIFHKLCSSLYFKNKDVYYLPELAEYFNVDRYSYELPKNSITMLESCGESSGEWKNSFHVIMNTGYVFKHGGIMKDMIESNEFIEAIKEHKITIPIDMNAYCGDGKIRNFRMPFACKEDSTRVMKPLRKCSTREYFDPNDITIKHARRFMVAVGDYDIARLEYYKNNTEEEDDGSINSNRAIQLFKEKYPEEARHHTNHATSTKGSLLWLGRKSKSICPFCVGDIESVRLHRTKPNIMLFEHNGIFRVRCHNDVNKLTVILNPEDVQTKYEENATDTPLTGVRLLYKTLGTAKANTTRIKNAKKFHFTDAIHSTENYVSDISALNDAIISGTSDIIVVSAEMGTGKTVMVNKALGVIAENEPDAKILISTMRISLAEKGMEDFPGYQNYLYSDGDLNDNKIVCQLDSFHRIKWKSADGYSCRCVVLDEADQQFQHLICPTYAKSPNVMDNIQRLVWLIRYAKQVILMSANITNRDIDWIKKIRCDKPGEIINNNVKCFVNEKPDKPIFDIDLTISQHNVIMDAINASNAGKRIYIACNGSAERIDNIASIFSGKINKKYKKPVEYIVDKPKKVLAISAATIKQKDVVAALRDVNGEFSKYDVIVASPSLQSGISYSVKDTFDNIYGIFGNWSNKSGDCFQMLRRIRHPTNNRMLVAIQHTPKNGICDRDEFMNSIIAQRQRSLFDVLKALDWEYNKYGAREYKNSQFLDWYITLSVDKNKDATSFTRNFIEHQIAYGNNVNIIDIIKPSEEEKDDEQIAAWKEQKNNELKGKEVYTFGKEINNEELAQKYADAEPFELESEINELRNKHQLNDNEKIQLHKHYINETYDRVNDFEDGMDYIKFGKKQMIKIYKNNKLYDKHRDNIDGALEEIRQQEAQRELNSRRINEEFEYTRETEQLIINSLYTKYEYARHKVIIEWMKIFEIDNLFSMDFDPDIEKTISVFVEIIANDYLMSKEQCAALGIKTSTGKHLTFKQSLSKINSIFNSELGFIFVKKPKQKDVEPVDCVYTIRMTKFPA